MKTVILGSKEIQKFT